MTFRCGKCGETSPKKKSANRVVTKTAPHQHPFREECNRDGSDDPGGKGSRIVSEMLICETCVKPVEAPKETVAA